MSARDGGPAFPRAALNMVNEPGMTLRDWFAGQALVGLLLAEGVEDMTSASIAITAYVIADAMIEERDKAGAR